MGIETGISWCDATWNPHRGCHKVSSGCNHCYMFREQKRHGRDPNIVVRSKTTFYDPIKWQKSGKLKPGSRIFVCSWSDFFIEEADKWRPDAWEIITRTPEFWYLILTKRPERMLREVERIMDAPSNIVWMVTGETQKDCEERVDILTDLRVMFPNIILGISIEPQLELISVENYLPKYCCNGEDCACKGMPRTPYYVDWIICGGESGPGHRPFNIEWARILRDECKEAGVAFFMKQLGGWPNKHGKLSDFPEDLRVRQFPKEVV